MRRVIALMVLVTVLSVPPSVDGQTATTYVEEVTVSPAQPAPGERFTVTTTIRNAESSPAPVTITDVALRNAKGTEYERVERLGKVPPGGTLEVPLVHRFDEPGTRNLRVLVFGFSGDRNVELRYPVVVTLRSGGPQVSIETPDAVVGTESSIRVRAANGEDAAVRNVRLSLEGGNASVANATRVVPRLGAGETRSFGFRVTPERRQARLTATLRYTTAAGAARTTRETVDFAADPLEEDVRVEASVPGEGGTPPVVVDVSNFGNAPLEEVTLRAGVEGRVLRRKPVDPIRPDASRSVRLNLSGADPPANATLDVVAEYEIGSRTGTARTTVAYASSPGRIELTGVDFERAGDRVHITGSASNVGLTEVNSVVVRVRPAPGVRPARPFREYFVGTVPSSDFVSFDLYATVEANATRIPVEITYLVDGERRRSVRELPAEDVPPASGSGRSGPSFPLLAGGAVAALVVLALGGYAFVRR